MSKSGYARLGWVVASAAVLGGCAAPQPSPRTDAQLESSVRRLWVQQTLNPDASRNNSPVNGIDAVSAGNIIRAYQGSFGGGGTSGGSGAGAASGGASGGSGSASSSGFR